MSDEVPSQKELEDLLVNNEGLQAIEAYLNRFNPIRVMRMERMEIRHSAILAWLLDPLESHGLGDAFLRTFLGEALKGQAGLGYPNALDIAQADLKAVSVRREWQNLDLFIHSPENEWAFVVENKFDSSQHQGQLSKYIEKVLSIFVGRQGSGEAQLRVRGIFLTLHDEEPQDAAYAPIGYDAVREIVGGLIKQKGTEVGTEVRSFLSYYVDILEEALNLSDDHKSMERLARQLYHKHRKALQFVIEHGETTNFEIAMYGLVNDDPEYDDPIEIDGSIYYFNWICQEQASFIPESWFKGLGEDTYNWNGCEGWWMGEPLIAWFELLSDGDSANGQLRLYAEVGPITEYEFRSGLIKTIEKAADEAGSKRIKFQRGAADEGKRYSKFFKNNSVHINDVQDADEITNAVKQLLKRFKPELDLVGSVLKPFQKYGVEQ